MKPAQSWFIFQNECLILMQNPAGAALPDHAALLMLQNYFLREHNMGIINDNVCHCAELQPNFLLPQPLIAIPLRKAFDLLGIDWYVTLAKAAAILNWDKNHQYCGRCAASTFHPNLINLERICSACKLSFFPRISPSIIVLIAKGDHILMSRSPHFSPGSYGLIAGFVEAGESLEDTVHREVKEEVSISIKNLKYFSSQAWPFPDSLMVGFFADYDSGEIIIDNKEIETAGWYHYQELPGKPSTHLSIAQKLLDHFIGRKTHEHL